MLKPLSKATLDSSPHPTGEVDSHAVAADGDGDAESLLEHQGERDEEDEEDEKVVEEEEGEEMEEDEAGGGNEGEGGSDLLRDQDDDTSKKHEGCRKEPSSNPEKSFVNSANPQAEHLRDGNLGNHSPSKLHIKQTSENNNGDLSQPTSQRRPRSSSPCIQHESKNPAIICNFFASGWCIKGSSCKFLHKKEVVDYANLGTQEDRSTKDTIDCKGMPNVGNLTKSDFLLQRALVQTYGGETHGFSQFKDTNFQASKNDEHFQVDGTRQPKFQGKGAGTDVPIPYTDFSEDRYSSSVEISSRHFSSERMMYKEMPSGEHRYDASFSSASSLIKNPFTSESNCSVGGSSMLLNVHNDSCDIYSTGKKPDDLARQYQPSHFTLHGSYTSGLSSSIKSNFDYCTHSLRESPAIESLHSFAQAGTRLAQGSPLGNISADSLSFSGLQQKLQANTWETSVPFRPSFSLAPFIKPFCDSQYDPFVDSIDHPKRALTSTSPKGTLVGTESQHTIGAPIAGDFRPGYDASKSVNSFASASEGILGIRKEVHEYSSYTTLSPGFTTKDEEKGQIPDLTNPAPVNESELGNNSRVDKVKYTKESKAMKIFHAALVEFLKELLKPSWKEGRLNKDTHKLIVKKAADKVLGVLQPHQVPNGPEAIDQYLSSSKPKLLKLVEAYVDKHSKS
ncbi:protein FRIGIDA-ESSENTIAL 1-like [Curcuma longa]|uniref:protein FRIGIDA-ESSENTIAL 1-like n=1 Tax=Curcuma longa TaxID=136217 RepID=UPI003D9F2BA4